MTEYVAAKRKHGSLAFLKTLLEDKEKKVHGVFYTNDFFSKHYLSRSHVLSDEVNIEDKTLKLKISTRVERSGILELENTLDMLVLHEAGDIPGFAPEGEQQELPVPEPISITQWLYSVDLVLIMKEPKITYQVVTITDVEFVLVSIDYELAMFEDTFNQRVNLLFGAADKFNFFSHFFSKELNTDDKATILKLILDENLTGKAILGVEVSNDTGVNTTMFPLIDMIGAYTTDKGEIVFSGGSGYTKIPKEVVWRSKMQFSPHLSKGQFRIELINDKTQVRIIMEP